MPEYTQDNLLFTVITPLGKDELLFKSLQGTEQLSGLFDFHVEMLSESRKLNFDEIVGQNLTVKVEFAPEHVRYFNGVVTRFVQAGSDARMTIYQAQIRPWLWQLTLTRNCRIFQHLSVPDIIKKVFTDLGFFDFRFSLAYPYEPRVYCVQYQETAFDFVCRLMEDVGIYYFFEHSEDKHTLVLADFISAHQPAPGISTVRYLEVFNQTELEDVVTECHLVQQMTTRKYAIDDFNFETPSRNLESAADSQIGSNMRIYEYAAGFADKGQGNKKADKRIESCLAEHKILQGQGHCFSFTSGYKFTLARHLRNDFNMEYLLREVVHSLSLTHYSNSFIAVPANIKYRAPIVTSKPQISSSQTAIVTGPAGEEIYSDKYGRIKVQFHWDQEGKYDENSSCWIRVNQGWAGKGWGNIFIPRIGQEVIISYLNGNPDTPIVTGAVYNAEQVVPYPLPANQTKSTLKSNSSKGGAPRVNYNEFRYEDKKGQEEIYLQAEKDWNILVKNDKTHLIQHDETLTVDNDRTRTVHHDEKVTIDNDRTKTVHHDESLTVDHDRTRAVHHDEKVTIDNDRTKTVHHDESLTVDNDRTRVVHHDEKITIDNDRTKQVKNNQQEQIGVDKTIVVGNNHNEKIGNNLSLEVGSNQAETIGSNHRIEVGRNMSLKVGRNKTDLTSIASAETVGLAKALTVGAAYQVSVGALMNETVGGFKMVQVGFSKTETVGGSHTTKAKQIILEASQEIVLKCGGGTITFDAEGNITIKGPLVKINT